MVFWFLSLRDNLTTWLLKYFMIYCVSILEVEVFYLKDFETGNLVCLTHQQVKILKINFLQYTRTSFDERWVEKYLQQMISKGIRVSQKRTYSHEFNLLVRNRGGPKNWQEKNLVYFFQKKNLQLSFV